MGIQARLSRVPRMLQQPTLLIRRQTPLALLRLGDDLGVQQLSLGSIDRSQRLTDAAP
ncbi:MAG: hypothetical protein LBJ40_18515 [Delftia acidovorans]|nr:hypothetical protein [Delftia acidovorans]